MRLCWTAMRLCWKGWALPVLLSMAAGPVYAATCTSQAGLPPQDREALAAAATRLFTAVAQQDFTTLQAALLPAEQAEWEGIRGAAEQAAPLVKDSQILLRNAYLLDATSLTAPADTQFFCSNTNGSLTVTVNMRALPPGRYAVVLADALGSPLAGQLGFILGWDGGSGGWKLGGFSARQGMLDGHDGVWYWTRARDQARSDEPWAAWFSYEAARSLLVPVDFLSSPNLEKLGQEQAQLKGAPTFPYSLPDGPRTWKIDAMSVDLSLHQADLGVVYESTGVSDPAAQRTEAIAVMSALLKAQPGLRDGFHGLWAYAVGNGKRTPVMELPMAQIP